MSFAISLQSELLKTKRTASFWLSIAGAAVIPLIFFLKLAFDPAEASTSFNAAPWKKIFSFAWQFLSGFLLPMYIILICALIPQIEFKNNAWKQVFASPQTTGQIFFAKFLTVHLMIFLCYTLFNVLMILCGVGANLIHSQYKFLATPIDWERLAQLNLKTYFSILGISAIQFWLSIRFKSFIGPVGIGLALLVGGIIANATEWAHAGKIPYAHPIQTLISMKDGGKLSIAPHEWWAIGYFIFFTLLGFLDLRFRKEKG